MRNASLAVVFLFLLLAGVPVVAADKPPQQLYDEAVAAYRKKDFAGYLAGMEALAKIRGYQPATLFNYAGALALNNRPIAAIAQLRRLAQQKVVMDLADADFNPIRNRADFRAIAQVMAALRVQKISSSTVAFKLPLRGAIPEAIAYDPKTKAFFVSSVRNRKIVRIDAKGNMRDFVTKDVRAVGGLAVDGPRRILWASSGAYARMERFTEAEANENTLFALNADTGALIARYDAPKSEPHAFDGVSVDGEGNVFVSDGRGALYRLAHGAKALELFVKPGTIRSPQGSAVAADGTLYVADYSGLLWAVDRRTGSATALTVPDDLPTYGIDGLAVHGRTLYAVQNGVTPNRVVRLQLDDTGRKVTSWRVLDMNDGRIDEPTNGVFANGSFYWIANSQGHLFDEKTPPKADELAQAVVMRVPVR
jgi:sugar lactone lactonase YvrE